MKKYLFIIKTTFNDSIQYISSLFFRFIGFAITMFVLVSLWSYIYGDPNSIIKGYTFGQMIWYLLLAEIITYGSGSKVATDEIRDNIRSGNIAYQVNKPYNYIGFTISKFMADTLIRFIAFTIIAIIMGLIFAGAIPDFNPLSILAAIPIFLLAVLITGMIRILISLSSFWVEDSKPFQNVYNKFILMFGVFFPIEMFPKFIGNIIKYTPIYSVSYGPAKLILNFSSSIFKNILLAQIITIIIVTILLIIIYKKGVKKLNVNGG